MDKRAGIQGKRHRDRDESGGNDHRQNKVNARDIFNRHAKIESQMGENSKAASHYLENSECSDDYILRTAWRDSMQRSHFGLPELGNAAWCIILRHIITNQ